MGVTIGVEVVEIVREEGGRNVLRFCVIIVAEIGDSKNQSVGGHHIVVEDKLSVGSVDGSCSAGRTALHAGHDEDKRHCGIDRVVGGQADAVVARSAVNFGWGGY